MISISIEIFCDKCTEPFGTMITRSIRQMREYMKADGWKYQKGTIDLPALHGVFGDYCPHCLKEHNGKDNLPKA